MIVIGSGPGGYAAAIRGAQLGLETAIVERAELGGVCLNRGCIPTKALLKSASVYHSIQNAAQYGIEVMGAEPNLHKIIERSGKIAEQMSKGIEFLMKKNNITVIKGFGRLTKNSGEVDVEGVTYQAKNIILATGARPRTTPSIPINGTTIITSNEALKLETLPQEIVVVGSGAIGSEFATFYSMLGSKVTIIEYAPRITPLEDSEISAALERAMRKARIKVMCATKVERIESQEQKCKVIVSNKKGEATIDCDVVLSAIGITPNIENLALEEAEIKVENGKIVVDSHYQTTRPNVYAIGDIIATPALAHVATAEAIHAVEQIAGLNPKTIDYNIIPSCIYTTPEISSVGLTQQEAEQKGYKIKIGKFPYTASGKATAAGARDGMVKLVFDQETEALLGAHLIGMNTTELVGETTLAMKLKAKIKDIIETIHAHPTMHEAIMEAAAQAKGEAIHI